MAHKIVSFKIFLISIIKMKLEDIINKSKKFIKRSIMTKALITTMLLSNPTAYSSDNKKDNDGYRGIFRVFSLSYHPNIGSLNLSKEIRYVPIHPDDGIDSLSTSNGPIEPSNIDNLQAVNFNIAAGLAYKKNNFEISGGLQIGFFDIFEDGGHHIRNYTNDPGTTTRGYGAALTYYMFNSDGPRWHMLQPFLELGYYFNDDNKFLIGMNLKRRRLVLETGWDRYNAYENYENREIGTLNFYDIYAGFSLPIEKNENELHGRIIIMGGILTTFGEGKDKGINMKNSGFGGIKIELGD